jgi:hypothetical protein
LFVRIVVGNPDNPACGALSQGATSTLGTLQ